VPARQAPLPAPGQLALAAAVPVPGQLALAAAAPRSEGLLRRVPTGREQRRQGQGR
jgi:hypothetical protein